MMTVYAGVALHPTVWSSGGPVKKRQGSCFCLGSLPGSLVLLVFGGMGQLVGLSIEVGEDDVGFWPYSVGLLVKFCSFLSSLHWPSTVDDLGVGGVSFVELLLLYERWAGERLVLEMSVPKSRRLHRPISVSAVPDGPSTDIWRSCRFLGAMIRALSGLPGGLGRFLPCRIGANHCRLRSIGWERCGHGLTSRPLEASDAGFLDDLLIRLRLSCWFWSVACCLGLAVLRLRMTLRTVRVLVDSSSGSAKSLLGFRNLSLTDTRKWIRLAKKTNGSTLRLFVCWSWGTVQFPNVGRLAPCGIFAFHGE